MQVYLSCRACATVLNQTKNKTLQLAISDVITSVEGGLALSVALSHHPKIFNQVFVSLVAAGEASGTLDVALERIANQQEKDAEIISKVRGAMVYPVIVLFVMGGVVTFMIVSVLPQVEELYKGMPNAKLPFVTTALLALSHFTIKFWWVMLLLFVFAIFITTKWARTLGGKRYIDRLKMKTWPVGPLFMKMYMARFSRTGTTLVASGVPLIQVLDITAKAINNIHLESSINRAIDKVKRR